MQFDYTASEPLSIPVSEHVTATLKPWNTSSAVLSFSDPAGHPIEVPTGVRLLEVDGDSRRPPLTKKPGPGAPLCMLAAAAGYDLYDGGRVVFRLTSKRVASITLSTVRSSHHRLLRSAGGCVLQPSSTSNVPRHTAHCCNMSAYTFSHGQAVFTTPQLHLHRCNATGGCGVASQT